MRRTLLLLALLLVALSGLFGAQAVAQTEQAEGEEAEERELETDRDAFTPATSLVGACNTVVETSYSFIDNRNVAATHSYPELLVRYGLGELFEFRIGWNYEAGGASGSVSGSGGGGEFESTTTERESQLLYGFKAAITEQDGWQPRSAVIVQGYTPTLGESTVTDVVAGYVFGWELPNKCRLDSAIRYATEHAAEDAFSEWAPSVALRMPLNEQWHAHVEYFGIYSRGAEQEFSRAFFSPGAHYLLTPNLELGARVGWGLTDDSPNFFSNVGVGWRF